MRIKEKFEELKKKKEGALIGFVTVGDPTEKDTLSICNSLIKGGIDMIELGLPFSDPIADGPTIQKATFRALKSGMNPNLYFETVEKIKGIPKICLTYYNLVLQRGLEKFVRDCKGAGISGLIVPDLPIEEALPLLSFCEKYGVDLIFLVAPTTNDERLKKIIKVTKGFLYLVSLLGVTGAREKLSEYIKPMISRIRRISREVKIAVGFGISKPSHVKEILRAGGDGVILGSAFIKIIEKNLNQKGKMLSELEKFTRQLKRNCSL